MCIIDVHGNPFYYHGDLELNDFEKEHKRLSYSNMLKVFTDGFILNNKVASRFAFDYLDENNWNYRIEGREKPSSKHQDVDVENAEDEMAQMVVED